MTRLTRDSIDNGVRPQSGWSDRSRPCCSPDQVLTLQRPNGAHSNPLTHGIHRYRFFRISFLCTAEPDVLSFNAGAEPAHLKRKKTHERTPRGRTSRFSQLRQVIGSGQVGSALRRGMSIRLRDARCDEFGRD